MRIYYQFATCSLFKSVCSVDRATTSPLKKYLQSCIWMDIYTCNICSIQHTNMICSNHGYSRSTYCYMQLTDHFVNKHCFTFITIIFLFMYNIIIQHKEIVVHKTNVLSTKYIFMKWLHNNVEQRVLSSFVTK